MTLPLVLALERRPELIGPVRGIHGGDDAPLSEVRKWVIETGACDDVRKLAAENTTRALQVLASVRESPARALLENVVAELAQRSG
jgi:geranylgeranyl pyrophosphate synthase